MYTEQFTQVGYLSIWNTDKVSPQAFPGTYTNVVAVFNVVYAT
ncbi:hypothetical protein COO91_08773 [Nostoc flagelliforme CCNUN1]|uniref:Uncharacterized protein n=1 Tax=Nostoc flagelliforme CCNUN1 TaxID=2038116 RepID=A0A2K8T4P4_9NOSO|nr:hypothetical protein COO91_08773 [Nostoc flagelliforme CCNUN1]